MPHDCILATGAKPGDKVRCVSVRDDNNFYFTGLDADLVYEVVDFCGGPHVMPQGDKKGASNIPRKGYGATWELVA